MHGAPARAPQLQHRPGTAGKPRQGKGEEAAQGRGGTRRRQPRVPAPVAEKNQSVTNPAGDPCPGSAGKPRAGRCRSSQQPLCTSGASSPAPEVRGPDPNQPPAQLLVPGGISSLRGTQSHQQPAPTPGSAPAPDPPARQTRHESKRKQQTSPARPCEGPRTSPPRVPPQGSYLPSASRHGPRARRSRP